MAAGIEIFKLFGVVAIQMGSAQKYIERLGKGAVKLSKILGAAAKEVNRVGMVLSKNITIG
jgi:hypothetical protein